MAACTSSLSARGFADAISSRIVPTFSDSPANVVRGLAAANMRLALRPG
jgi:hypothetical protein